MMKLGQIQSRIEAIQEALRALGPMRPGTLCEQYNVCGTPGCHCKDPKHPRRHGPYYHLKYTWHGKGHTRFVKAEDIERVRKELETYKQFRDLCDEWVSLSLERVRVEREG